MPIVAEPKRCCDIESLYAPFRAKVKLLLQNMEAKGYDPVVFEALRTPERHKWLYGIGRTHDLDRKPVTWTMHSLHLTGKGADIISHSKGWNWPEFFDALEHEAEKLQLITIPQERCHVQFK